MTTSLRVLIADDHPALRGGVRSVLEEAGCTVCAEVANARDAVDQAVATRPDLCLLDIGMPGNGIRATTEILTALPDTKVLMLTISDTSEDLVAALRAGAVGYLLKDIVPGDLVQAVRQALEGEVVLSRPLTTTLVRELRGVSTRGRLIMSHGREVELTPREWDVMKLLAEGLSTNEVAARLLLRPPTVRRHVGDVVHKFGLRSRAEAIRMFADRS